MKSHCSNGHEIRSRADRDASGHCSECRRARQRERSRQMREALRAMKRRNADSRL